MSRYRKTMREALEEVYASDFNEGKMKDVYTMQQSGATAREIADKMKLPLKVVKDILGEDSINEKFTKKDFDRNEDENEHTKNSYELAKMFGDTSEKSRMTRLYNKTRKVGSFLTKAENDFVTMIQSKYYRRLREELELDELQNYSRQLKDPSKEMLVVDKEGRVSVIDKSEFEKYKRQGYTAAEEVQQERLVPPSGGNPAFDKTYVAHTQNKQIKDKLKDMDMFGPKRYLKVLDYDRGGKIVFFGKGGPEMADDIKKKGFKVTTEEVELNEYSSQQIKQAYGILNDPRYKGGDYTGAVKAIEKLAKGLSRHPDVANALKRANEELDKDDTSIVKQVVAKLKKASKAHADQSKALDKAIKEEKDLDEGKFTLPTRYVVVDTRTNKVTHASSDDKDLKLDVGRKSHLKIVKLKKPVSQKKTGYLLGEPLKAWGEEVELTEYFATVHSKKPAIVKFINANKKNIDYVDVDAGNNIEFEGKGAHELADKVKAKFGVRVTKEETEKVELNDIDENFSPAMIAQLKKAYGPLKGKRIPPGPLMKIFDKIDKDKNALIQLFKAHIPFVSQMAVARLISKHNMSAGEINKLDEEVDLDESLFSTAVDKMIKRAKSLKKEPFIKKYMGTSIMPGSKILDRKSLANIWDIHNAQMSSVHEEEELKEFNPNFGRDAQAGRGSTQTGERDRIVKDQKDKEKEIQSLKNDIMLLKNKLENEKNKAVKPEPNPETGEVPLTVGIAYKVFKDQEKKKIEKVKNIPNKFKLKEKYLGERAYRIKFDNVDGAIGHREADAVQADLKKMGFSARVNLTGHAKDELFFNTGVEKDQMKRLLTKAGYDLAEAVIAGKDYKYDGIGPIKISKKMYAKVQRDSKGKDFSGKPYMMALNPKTQETELVPVKFTEELEESTASDQAKALGLTYYKFGRYGKGGKVTHKSTGGELRKFDAKTGKVGDVETKGKDDDAKSDSGDEKEVNSAGMTKSEMQKGLFKKDGSPSAGKLKGLITDKIRSQSGLGDSLGYIEYEYKGKDTLRMDADDSDELVKELEKNFGDALEIEQDYNFVTARVKSKDELGDKDEPVDTSIPEPVRKMTKKINNSNFNNLNNMIAKFKRGSDEIDKEDAKDFEELIKLGQNVKLDGKKDKGKKEFIKKFKTIDEPAASDFVRALEKDVGEKAANYMLGTYDEAYIPEADLTDKQVKMVKKVAEKLPMKDFKKRYGKDAMNVKFGTATNIVKKKLNIDHNDKHAGARQVVESIKAVKNKAEKTGMPYSILKKVYDRGMAAWKGGHRPGATQVQWALARVNSFVTKSSGTWGKADKDLAAKVRAQKKD